MPVIEPTTGFLHEDGSAEGVIVRIEEDEGLFGAQLKFIIEIEADGFDDDGNPRETWAYTSFNYSSRSKLGQWTLALLGEMPEPLDTDDLVGLTVDVGFEQYDKIDPISGQKVTKEKVVSLRPA